MINNKKEILTMLKELEKTVTHSSMSFDFKIQTIKKILELKKIF